MESELVRGSTTILLYTHHSMMNMLNLGVRKLFGGVVLLGVVLFLAYYLIGANMGMQGQDRSSSVVSVTPEVTEDDGEFTVSGELDHFGFESETGVIEGVRVRILAADNSTLKVVELGDVELASIEPDAHTFTVTTDREPARLIVEIDAVRNLESDLKLQVKGRYREGDNWVPFYESPDTWRYDVTQRESRVLTGV